MLTRRGAAVLAACLLAPAAPAAAQTAAPPAATAPVQASQGYVGGPVRFRGAGAPGARVEIQRLSGRRGWVRTAVARVGRDGRFLARWRADEAGRFPVRVVPRAAPRAARGAAPAGELVVFRRVRATWYGPGLFGRRTACGLQLTPDLMGVAHRTLPCGTPVEIAHGALTVTVPVVDRGPFANAAHYDLTAAAARTVGFAQTGRLGVLPRRGARMTPPPAPDAARIGAGGGTAPS